MGDCSFFAPPRRPGLRRVPLIAGLARRRNRRRERRPRSFDAELSLTMAGEDVRDGGEDHVALSGIDRWWGGTRLLGRSVWRYDREAQTLVPPAESGA